jgi:hypothetical protein
VEGRAVDPGRLTRQLPHPSAKRGVSATSWCTEDVRIRIATGDAERLQVRGEDIDEIVLVSQRDRTTAMRTRTAEICWLRVSASD